MNCRWSRYLQGAIWHIPNVSPSSGLCSPDNTVRDFTIDWEIATTRRKGEKMKDEDGPCPNIRGILLIVILFSVIGVAQRALEKSV